MVAPKGSAVNSATGLAWNNSFGLRSRLGVHSFRGGLDEVCYSLWLRHVDRVTAGHIHCSCTGAFGHELLGGRWNHFVVGRDEIPGGLLFPRRTGNLSTQCFNTPRHL